MAEGSPAISTVSSTNSSITVTWYEVPAAEARGKITGYKIFYQADSGTEENKEVEEVSALVHITISKQFSWLANTIMSSLIYRIATAGHTAHLPLTNPM